MLHTIVETIYAQYTTSLFIDFHCVILMLYIPFQHFCDFRMVNRNMKAGPKCFLMENGAVYVIEGE